MPYTACLNCGSSEMERPLIPLKFQAKDIFICPQCLPILIHKPYQLAEKLPDFSAPGNPPADDH